MSCGKKPLRKLWDKPRSISVIKPSKYEQNEATVRQHWRNVVKELESTYKDEKFWESHADKIHFLGPLILKRLGRIFNLPKEKKFYDVRSDISIVPSDRFYKDYRDLYPHSSVKFSMSDFEPSTPKTNEEIEEEYDEEFYTVSSMEKEKSAISFRASLQKSQSKITKSSHKSFNKSRSKFSSKSRITDLDSESTTTNDDLEVLVDKKYTIRRLNRHYNLLFCTASETDMISWKSKYKNKALVISTKDDFNKKAEITTKKIAKEFYDWWTSIGTEEFKSEIKRPEDIENLFQVWFDEHASRGLVIDPKILPCVLQSVARAVGVPKAACASVLRRQVKLDIEAETSPAHIIAFGTCLPQKHKHIPPNNNTAETWHRVRIPEDLKSMSCVWQDIEHLTSTKAFKEWLLERPNCLMPPCLMEGAEVAVKKPLFIVPSDFVVGTNSDEIPELAFPVSKVNVEVQDVLEKVMND